MRNEKTKNWTIVLWKNGIPIPQYGLYYESEQAAQHAADYMNSILPQNIRVSETYSVAHKSNYPYVR